MKIRIPLRTRWQVETLRFYLALFCISSYALLEHVSVSLPAFSPIKYILLYIAGMCSVFEIPVVLQNIRKKKYFYVAVLMLLLFSTLLLSAYMNRSPVVGSSPMYGTVRLILYMAELYVLVIWVSQTERVQCVVRFLFRYLLVTVIVTDFVLLTGLLQFSSGSHTTYIIGTKFSVAYRHIELLALWLMCDRERFMYIRSKKRWMIPMMIFVVVISYSVDCVTGILGIIGFLMMYSFVDNYNKNRIRYFTNPMTLAVALLCSAFFALIIGAIATTPIFEFIIENVLQRDTTLTGRVFIFNMFGEKMTGHWLFGFGFGNGNPAAMRLFRYANAQNALLHWILQTGILTTICLCFWLCRIFYQLHNSEDKCGQITPIVVLVYVFVVLGVIETTFNMAFIMWCALIFMHTSEINNFAPTRLNA